ncbi:DUF3352 domain-containing protein [Baekduia soli]|uniref:DUF3352 domain-containing protein n=1 Tax=Baekduia soli TaxID=496014 RepID=A0A5B8U650_9ACTN|nr:DUF3352 domain-containing protein [Baekduia soli]QEC48596.1 DUF3352 domain-containing protein [Baekduia soli]
MAFSLLPRSLAALATIAAVAVPVAGCGSSSTSSSGGNAGADPASALPATAPFYLEAQLRPQGDLKANVESVAKRILATDDPSSKIVSTLDQALSKKGSHYRTDIQPWLGNRAGLAVTAMGSGGAKADVAAVIASKDDDKAKAFVAKQQQGAAKAQYRGVSYTYDRAQDMAATVLDGEVILGTDRGFKSAIDATKGGSLAEAKNFKDARDEIGTDGLGFVYVDPSRALDLALGAAGSAAAGQSASLKSLLAGSGVRSVAAKLEVAQDALRVDAAVLGRKAVTAHGDAAGAAASVPADAWLSVGIGDVGGAFQRQLKQLGQAGATGGVDPATLLQQLKGQLGVDVQQDFLSWMGDGALFVRGTSMSDLGGALVVTSKDPAASQRAIGTIRDLLTKLGARPGALRGGAGAEGLSVRTSGIPEPIEIAAKGDRFVIAYGRAALDAALGGGQKLGDSAGYKTAAGLLDGAKPALFLDTAKVVRLIGAVAGGDASFAKAKPTLDAFGPLAAGSATEDGVSHVKVAVQVK